MQVLNGVSSTQARRWMVLPDFLNMLIVLIQGRRWSVLILQRSTMQLDPSRRAVCSSLSQACRLPNVSWLIWHQPRLSNCWLSVDFPVKERGGRKGGGVRRWEGMCFGEINPGGNTNKI